MIQRIAELDPVHGGIVAQTPGDLHVTPLPFYSRHSLVTARLPLANPPLTLFYVDDGEGLTRLDGRPATLYALNARDNLNLRPAGLPAYVKFFLFCSSGFKVSVVEIAEDFRWQGSLDAAQAARRNQALSHVEPLRVVAFEEGKAYRVIVHAIHARQLVRLELDVSANGAVEVLKRDVLVPDLPLS
jgi:hypothetical protein